MTPADPQALEAAARLRRTVVETGAGTADFEPPDGPLALRVEVAMADIVGPVWLVALDTRTRLRPADRRRFMRALGRVFNPDARPSVDKDMVRTPMTAEDANQWRQAATAAAERTNRAVVVPPYIEDDEDETE